MSGKYERLKCPDCDLDFGQEQKFLAHAAKDHGVTDHLQRYLDTHNGGQHPTCQCSPDCQEKVAWAGWKKGFTSRFIRGHNAKIDSSFHNADNQKKMADKRTEGYRSGRISTWNDGLSKETSDVIREASEKTSATLNEGYSSGRLVDWRVGNEEKAKAVAAKISATKTKMYARGELKSWNDGLNKETCEKLKLIGQNISRSAMSNVYSSGKRFKPEELREMLTPLEKESNLKLLMPLNEYRNRFVKLDFLCSKCNKVQVKSLSQFLATPICFSCNPRSKRQMEIYEFVSTLCCDAINGDRTVIGPKEIDVYVPSKKFGIEFDGLYWHSEHFSSQEHTLEKLALCDAADVRLFRIFDDEWREKRPIVESMIRHRLGVSTVSIGARKCDLVVLSTFERRSFFEANHIDGDVPSVAAWGLKNDGKIIAALSVRAPFHKGNADVLEVARFATALNTSVPGALQRLTVPALERVRVDGKRALMTFVDRRIGSGNGYKAAGWKVTRVTPSRWWWTNFVDRFDRFTYRADKKRGMSQAEVAEEAGVVRLWDIQTLCLNEKFNT